MYFIQCKLNSERPCCTVKSLKVVQKVFFMNKWYRKLNGFFFFFFAVNRKLNGCIVTLNIFLMNSDVESNMVGRNEGMHGIIPSWHFEDKVKRFLQVLHSFSIPLKIKPTKVHKYIFF